MTDSMRLDNRARQTVVERHEPARRPDDTDSRRQLSRWGGTAALLGVLLMVLSVAAVAGGGLPDASDPESLTDFANIETGRLAENTLYFGALLLFAFHFFALHRLLRSAHAPAALFGTVAAGFGLVMMASSALIHVATSPLSDLYNEAGVSAEDQQAIVYAWHGMQAVMDMLLASGVMLVPIGIILFGIAMRRSSAYGTGFAAVALILGAVGVIGAAIGIINPGSMLLALGVLAIVLFSLIIGWRTLRLPEAGQIDLT